MKCCVAGKKVFSSQTCSECPEYNMCGVFVEGIENEIPCMPGFGGKVCTNLKTVFEYSIFSSKKYLLQIWSY